MINKIKIDFPDFNVKLEREFTPGINLIEEWNGYWKTTIISTILSIFTKSFRWSRSMPDGTAMVSMNDIDYLYSKKLWIGSEWKDPLTKHIIPGEFFKLTTSEQRLALVDVLKIDKEKFMKDAMPTWTPDLLKSFNYIIKRNEWRKEVIIEDIKRHDKIVKEFEANPFTIEDNSKDLWAKYRAEFALKNKWYTDAIEYNNGIRIKENNLKSEIAYAQSQLNSLISKRDALRIKFTEINTNWICPVCSWPLNKTTIGLELNKINAEWVSIKEDIDKENKKILDLNEQLAALPNFIAVPDRLQELTSIDEVAKFLGETVTYPTPEQVQKYNEYITATKELPHKKEELKKLGEIDIESQMEDIVNLEKKFTEYLQDIISETGLEINLFKTQVNWEVVETFSILLDGKPYSELSTGQRIILEVRIAKLFATKLWFDFILIDEAWTLSKDSYDMIASELEWFQVLLFRATPFTLSKPKKNVKAS